MSKIKGWRVRIDEESIRSNRSFKRKKKKNRTIED